MFIDYGQLNKTREYSALEEVSKELGIDKPVYFDFSSYANNIQSGLTSTSLDVVEDAFTPCRNLLFIVTGAAYAFSVHCNKIVLGLLSEETMLFPDQSDDFLTKAKNVVAASLGTTIDILTPLRDLSKVEVAALGKKLGVKTYYSCHVGGAMPCGNCIACKEYEGVE